MPYLLGHTLCRGDRQHGHPDFLLPGQKPSDAAFDTFRYLAPDFLRSHRQLDFNLPVGDYHVLAGR